MERLETFEKIGSKGATKIRESCVAIVGVGAIGSVSLELLARAGAGKILIIDRDIIERENIGSQNFYTGEDMGKLKAVQAASYVKKINPEVDIISYPDDLNSENIYKILKNKNLKIDLILDCTDNFETRFLMNDFCVKEKIPWIYSSCVRDEGYVMNIIPGEACFNCVFKGRISNETCDTSGVILTIANLIGSLQVTEALKMLIGEKVENDLIHFNIWDKEIRKIKISKNKNCDACNSRFKYLEKEREEIVKFCGSGNYQIKGKHDLVSLKKKLSRISKVQDLGVCLNFGEVFIFKDRVMVKAKGEKEARAIYSRFIGN